MRIDDAHAPSRNEGPQFGFGGLGAIAGRYDAVLCDVWGVIHNGRAAFQPACEALARFRREFGPVVLISNAPVPAAQVAEVFPRVGVPADCYDAIVTSGDATRLELARRAPGPCWRLGTDEGFERDDFLFEGLPLTFASMEEARFIAAMGLPDPVHGHPDDYVDLLRPAAEAGLEMICANPDIQVRVGERLWWCAGAIARVYERLGGPVVYPGKPHPAIYQLGYGALGRLIGRPVDKRRVLAIGDGIATDIRGAMREALDSLFVGTGLYRMSPEAGFAEQATVLFQAEQVHPTWAAPRLEWAA